MDITEIPNEFNSSIRLAIIAFLLDGKKTFSALKVQIGASDGNLGAHIRRLETSGYVLVQKIFVKRKPQTIIKITQNGKKMFKEYVDLLETIVSTAKITGRE